MLEILIFVVAVGLVVWLLSLLPIPEPFGHIIKVVAIILVIVALLDFLFGMNLLGGLRRLGR